jgi:hypothetical protein
MIWGYRWHCLPLPKSLRSHIQGVFPLTKFLFPVLAGLHDGCYELFGTSRVRAIRDLQLKDPSGGFATRALHYTVAGA